MSETKDLALREEVSKDKLLAYLDSMGLTSHLTEPMKKQFIEVAQGFGLNPFKREVHASIYNKWNPATRQSEPTLSIITGYEVYLKRAERVKDLNGWKCWTEGEGNNMVAKIIIHRKSWANPFEHEVEFSEYVQVNKEGKPNAMWGGKPKTMLKKVCIAQAFRLCFPDEFAGMPYTSDELPDNMTKVDVVAPKVEIPAPKEIPAEPKPVDAEVVEEKAEEPKTEAPGTEKMVTVTGVTRYGGVFKVKTEHDGYADVYVTEKEVLAQVAKMNISKVCKIRYTVDTDMKIVLLDIQPS